MSPFSVSGCTDWAKGTWVIVINGSEPMVRQRFTLAHEFKHILDYRYIDIAYPSTPSLSHRQRTEVVCDYFAGCLLVPRPWLKRTWCGGMQRLPDLARHFGVSQAAIQTRLLQTGLIDRPQRCGDPPAEQLRFRRLASHTYLFGEMNIGHLSEPETAKVSIINNVGEKQKKQATIATLLY